MFKDKNHNRGVKKPTKDERSKMEIPKKFTWRDGVKEVKSKVEAEMNNNRPYRSRTRRKRDAKRKSKGERERREREKRPAYIEY